MTNNVQCDEFAERLADLLERDVDEAARGALEAHALVCDDCGSLLADLRKLRIDASNLSTLTPGRDLWEGIADRIDAPVIPLHERANHRSIGPRPWRRWGSLAAAAAVLVAVRSITTHYVTVRTTRSDPVAAVAASRASSDSTLRNPAATVVAARSSDSATSSSSAPREADVVRPVLASGSNTTRLVSNRAKPGAEEVYASEIARLHRIVEQRRGQLDPVTVSVIERNLKVIDDAIAQCKVALANDPASRFLMESLNKALETKVELLRTAALLPARS